MAEACRTFHSTLLLTFLPLFHHTHTLTLPSHLHNNRRPPPPSIHCSVISSSSKSDVRAATTVIESIPWDCEIDSLENSESLQKWLRDSDLPKQKMGIQKVQVGERGLVALKNIRKGEKLLFVPPSLVITADFEWNCPEGGEVLKKYFVLDWPLIATYLISEASLQKSSRWNNYISTLPRQPYSLLCYMLKLKFKNNSG